MEQWLLPVFVGLSFFALNFVGRRRAHRTRRMTLVQAAEAAALGVLYGAGWIVSPIIGRALGIEIVGLIGLVALSILMALVIYSNLRKEDSRL